MASDLKHHASLVAAMAGRLEQLIDETRRRSPVRRAPRTSRPLTPTLATAIRAYAAANEDATEHAIAVVFGVNQGRVSEVLAGKRA